MNEILYRKKRYENILIVDKETIICNQKAKTNKFNDQFINVVS